MIGLKWIIFRSKFSPLSLSFFFLFPHLSSFFLNSLVVYVNIHVTFILWLFLWFELARSLSHASRVFQFRICRCFFFRRTIEHRFLIRFFVNSTQACFRESSLVWADLSAIRFVATHMRVWYELPLGSCCSSGSIKTHVLEMLVTTFIMITFRTISRCVSRTLCLLQRCTMASAQIFFVLVLFHVRHLLVQWVHSLYRPLLFLALVNIRKNPKNHFLTCYH